MHPKYRNFNQPNSTYRDNSWWLFILLLTIGLILISRLFYIQVIKHDTYRSAALSEQFKKFSIPAERGKISILDGDNSMPVVLNESKYLIYADPAYIENVLETSRKLQPIIGGSVDELAKKLSLKSRYVEILKKADSSTRDKVEQLDIKGIVSKEIRVRSYPQAQMAAQVLGFVNDDGLGQYGIEEWLDDELRGRDGLLKAITDIRGVPLAGNSDNIVDQPIPGSNITLTIDATIQRIAEDAIAKGASKTNAPAASAIVMNINNGDVKAMANWPSYDPANYSTVTDQTIYKNKTVTDALEAGSIMKPLTISAAIEEGLINSTSTYLDYGTVEVDGLTITNVLKVANGVTSIYDIVRYSLNTGAVHLLKLMGGGEVNKQARDTWHKYLSDHYQFGKLTAIEQPGESRGIIPDPDKGEGLNIQYANTSFGQGIAVSPIQMASALASIFNGGTYYKPKLLHSKTDISGKEMLVQKQVIKEGVVSSSTSNQVVSLLEQYAINSKQPSLREGFRVGGKTGTAQIPDGKGGYREDYYIGTYGGFLGGRNLEYVILVTISEPKVSGFAGSDAARPIYNDIVNAMMDSVTIDIKR